MKMGYSNQCGADFFPRWGKRFATKAIEVAPCIPPKVKQDMAPARVPSGQQTQNRALVNTSSTLTTPTSKVQVRYSMQALRVEIPKSVKNVIPTKSESRKRIEKMKAKHLAKLADTNKYLKLV